MRVCCLLRQRKRKESRGENKKEQSWSAATAQPEVAEPPRPIRGGYSALGYLGETRLLAALAGLAVWRCWRCCRPPVALLLSSPLPPCPAALLPCFWRSLPMDSPARSHGGSGVGTTRTIPARAGPSGRLRWARCSFFHSNAIPSPPPPTPKREPSLSARPHTTQQPSNQSTAPGSWPNSPGLYDDAALSCHSLIQISIPLSLFPHLHSVIFSILWCCLFCCPRLSTLRAQQQDHSLSAAARGSTVRLG